MPLQPFMVFSRSAIVAKRCSLNSVLKFFSVGFILFIISVFFVVVAAILQVCCNSSLGCTIYGAPLQITYFGGQVSWLFQ